MCAKSYQTFDHTADLGLSARGDTDIELFEALAEGLAAQLCEPAQVTEREARQLQATAEDKELLAVDFLWEIMSLIQVQSFLIARVVVTALQERELKATLYGEPYDPARHELLGEIKAVTCHQLRICAGPGGWTGQVILDI